MTRSLAIIPARAGSKRLPGKNVRDFLGKPLLHWSIEFAQSLSRFTEVMVSTDSQSIARVALVAGAAVPWLRPAELSSDSATTVDVVLHALARYAEAGRKFDYVAVLQPTTPLRLASRWHQAFDLLDAGASAALGVRSAPVHPFWSYRLEGDDLLVPFFPDELATRSQLLPKAFVVNGSLYLARSLEVQSRRTLAPPGVRGVFCEHEFESVDIDSAADWEEAERLIQDLQQVHS
jgi:CMP-N-acetylneuraminic acid synthetase